MKTLAVMKPALYMAEKVPSSKSEFAVFVNEEYLSRKREFKSLREATKNLYESFRFDYDWTLEDCYGLVRKN